MTRVQLKVLLLACFCCSASMGYQQQTQFSSTVRFRVLTTTPNRPSLDHSNRFVTSKISTSRNLSNDDEIPIPDRLLSCLPYVLPLLDGSQFGVYMYQRIPPLGMAKHFLLDPMLHLYTAIPFGGLLLFVGFSFLGRNQNLPRLIRFNIMQAILVDIALVFPELFGGAAKALPLAVVEPSTNFIFYAYAFTVGYCLLWNLRGIKPGGIPWISNAAEMQAGPF